MGSSGVFGLIVYREFRGFMGFRVQVRRLRGFGFQRHITPKESVLNPRLGMFTLVLTVLNRDYSRDIMVPAKELLEKGGNIPTINPDFIETLLGFLNQCTPQLATLNQDTSWLVGFRETLNPKP